MFAHLFLLTLGFSQDQERTFKPAEREISFVLPRICVECCMDIMFILDRSSSVNAPATGIGKNLHTPWERMREIAAQLSTVPLNRAKIRTAAMQMGDAIKVSSPTDLGGNTGIRFGLGAGPFPKSMEDWGNGAKFGDSDKPAWKLAAEIALKHFNDVKPAYETNKKCDPTNYARLFIWIVGNGPSADQDPCPNVLSQLTEANIQHHIVGAGPNWAGAIDGRKCMFSEGAATEESLKNAGEWKLLVPSGGECGKVALFQLDPCNSCGSSYLDVVFVLDESGSLCDPTNPAVDQPKGVKCKDRKEFDKEVDFVATVIAELGKKWNKHRVALWTFSTKAYNHFKLHETGGKSVGGEPNPMTESEVQAKLRKVKKEFKMGITGTALAYTEALGEIEFAKPRADGNEAKKVILFLTDGGPNLSYYQVADEGKRVKCNPKCSCAKSGYCIQYPNFWTGQEKKSGPGQQNMAVCTDSEDPNPGWIRYIRKAGGGADLRRDPSLTYADAAKTLDITLLMLMVGARAKVHEKDVDCLVPDGTKGGVLTAGSFDDILNNPAYRAAILNSACTGAPLSARSLVFTEWTKYEAYQEEQLMAKFHEIAMKQQISPTNYMWSGALVIGISVAFLYGKQSRSEYYTPLLSDELMDADGV